MKLIHHFMIVEIQSHALDFNYENFLAFIFYYNISNTILNFWLQTLLCIQIRRNEYFRVHFSIMKRFS